jgi:short-subunit dehydrogenase
MLTFKDKIAIVTGSAAGIGRGLAEELAGAGAVVIIADINFDKASKTAESICSSGGKAAAKKADVTKAEDIEKLIGDTVSEYGRLDYMFNNAGLALMGEIKDMTPDQYRRLIDVNIMGVVNGSRIAYSQMLKQGSGHIVNVGSVAGLFYFPIQTQYSATKHFVQGFTMGLRAEAAAYGVKASVICPMNIKSDMVEGSIMMAGSKDKEWFKNLPVKWMDANLAARKMLKEVARNKGIIIVPSGAKIIWRIFRMSPAAFLFMAGKAVEKFRTS